MGKWYEISRLPNKFEKGLTEVTATYQLNEDGTISIVNEGRLVDDISRVKQVRGKGWLSTKESSRLKVSFLWPFKGDYWIIKVDPDYTYALVGDPSGKYLWILSRENRLDPKIINELKIYASTLGFAVENMISSQPN